MENGIIGKHYRTQKCLNVNNIGADNCMLGNFCLEDNSDVSLRKCIEIDGVNYVGREYQT